MGSEVEPAANGQSADHDKPAVAPAPPSVSNKTQAVWKKQLKNLKTKDVGKKTDGLRYCAQDERFVREQSEVLSVLVDLLSRVKMPEVVAEALRTFKVFFTQPQANGLQPLSADVSSEPVQMVELHPELNRQFFLDVSCNQNKTTWRGGEPFVSLFVANVAPETKILAIEVFTVLMNHCTQIAIDRAETHYLEVVLTSGTPILALITCVADDNAALQLAAIECISLVFQNLPSEELFSQFNASDGLQKIQQLAQRPDRRYHSALLRVMESFSCHVIGREYLRASRAVDVIKVLLVSTVETTTTTIASVTSSPSTPIGLTVEEASLMHKNVSIACRTYARTLFGTDSSPFNEESLEDVESIAQVVKALIAILQRDITSAVSPPPPPSTQSGNSAAAQAAAAAAAAAAASLASLFSFSSSKCVDIITTLGRMVERCDVAKQNAKSNGILPVLLLAYRIPGDDALHQSADKLLHLCSMVNAPPVEGPTRSVDSLKVDAQLFGSVGSGGTSEEDPFLTPESVFAILDSAATNSAHSAGVIFRIVRWLATAVESPQNATALGEAAVATLTKILLQTNPSETLLCGFIAKCLQAVAAQTPEACEICASEGRNPVGGLVAFLSTASPPFDPTPPNRAVSIASEIEMLTAREDQRREQMSADEQEAMSHFELEWLTELDEPGTFDGHSLTQQCHSFDPFLCGVKAIEALASTYARVKSETSGNVDFADLLSQRIDASGKNPASTTATAKKKLGDAGVKTTSCEGVALCVLEKTGDVFRLLNLFSSKNGEVAVSLLTTIKTLLQLPGGVRAMLLLAKVAMVAHPLEDSDEVEAPEPVVRSTSTWPWNREQIQQTEHAWLLAPILSVFEAPVTCFCQLEAAIGVLTAMVDDGSDVAPSTPIPTSDIITTVEIPISDNDRFLNAALSHGLLVYLIAVLDSDRIPLCPKDASRRDDFATSAVALAHIFIRRGNLKQAQAVSRRQELLDLYEQTSAAVTVATGNKNMKQDAGPTIDIVSIQSQKLEYKARWASDLLDAAFTLPRFDYRHVPALLLSTQIGLNDIAQALLDAGASPDTPTSLDGTTPLMLALLLKNKHLVKSFLAAGANVDAITNDGRDISVWMCALVSPIHGDLATLISRIHSSTIGTKLVLPLDALIELDMEEGVPDADIFDRLLSERLDVNISNAQGDFVLHALLSQSVVRMRIRSLDVCFRYKSTHHNPHSLTKRVIDLVENHSADLGACNRLGQTPLHLALLYGHAEAVLYLLEKGANPNVRDSFGMLPLHYACLGFFATAEQAVQVVSALLSATPKHELVLGIYTDSRKYKTPIEKAAVEVDALLERGLVDVTAPPALVRTLATIGQVLGTKSEFPDGFLPWHLTCGACSHENASLLCLPDEMNAKLHRNGEIRAIILEFLVKCHKVSLETRTAKQLTGLHLAVKTDVDGSNKPVIAVLLSSPSLQLAFNFVHEPTLIDTLSPIAEGRVIELTTDDLLYISHAHISTRSLTHKYHVILPDGSHLESLERHQLKVKSLTPLTAESKRYTLRVESAFSALHYAVQTSDDLSRMLLGIPGIALQPEGSDLPLLALACAARRSADVVSRLVNAQANVRVNLPLHDGFSHEQSGDGSLTSGRSGGESRPSGRKQAAALHFAVMYEDIEVVRTLVSSTDHTNVNVRRSGDGFTPLHLACGMGNMEIIKILLEHGANFIQMSTVSSASSGVTPLHLLLKADGVENEKLKELIGEGYLKPEMLLAGLGAPPVVPAKPATLLEHRQSTGTVEDSRTSASAVDEGQEEENEETNDEENEIEVSCVLLDEEEHNLSLYNHVQQLLARKRGATGYAMRMQTELTKSDEVLTLFFNLITRTVEPNNARLAHVTEEDCHAIDSPRMLDENLPQSKSEEETSIPEAHLQFSQLRHWHECYAQQQVRSQWIEAPMTSRMMRRSSFNRRSTNELLALTDTDHTSQP